MSSPTHRSRPRPRTAPPPRSAADELETVFAATATAAGAAPAPTSFSDLKVPDRLVSVLARSGVTRPTPIQARTVPDALAGRDVLGRAQTGSGKTLAFGLPLLTALVGTERAPGRPGGLVLVPTRELALQVQRTLDPLAQAVGLRTVAVYGGAPVRRQIDALRRGVDVVVATPGRLLDLVDQRECALDRVEVTVLDEADYMADLGFLPAVTRLLDATPLGGQRLLFSATLDRGIGALVRRYLTDPAAHAVAPAAGAVATSEHRAFTVRADDKLAVTAEIAGRPGRTLLFVRTKHGADRLAKQLSRHGVDAVAIHGNLAQNARQRALDAFAAGSSRVLVATDVAARGIHVDDVDLVVHVDPPADEKDYLHRSGRTARAGADGVVLSLLLPEQLRDAARLRERAGVTAAPIAVHPGHGAVRDLATSGTPIAAPPVSAPAGPTRRTPKPPRPRSSTPRGRGARRSPAAA